MTQILDLENEQYQACKPLGKYVVAVGGVHLVTRLPLSQPHEAVVSMR